MENNQNQDIYEDQNEEKLKKLGKDATKQVANKAKKATKKAIKEILIKLIKTIGIKYIAIAVAVVLGIILLASFWWSIDKITFDSISELAKNYTEDGTGNIKNITTIDEDKRELNINSDEFIKQIKQWFKSNNIKPATLGLYDDNYSTLVTFLEAEAVSSFPDLRQRDKIGTPIREDEIQGTVQFNRKYSDGTEQLLEFMKYTEYRKELAKLGVKLDDEETQEQIYFEKAQVENAFNSLKTYFTLDDEYNVIIANICTDERKVTHSNYAKEEGCADDYSYNYSVNATRINYQSVVQKYTMPFEFPLALLLNTYNPHFCEEVAKLAIMQKETEETTKSSFTPKIVVDVQDNKTDTYIKEDYGYTANFRLEKDVTYKVVVKNNKGDIVSEQNGNKLDGSPIVVEKTVSADSYKITENWTYTTTSQLCISEADTWIADYKAVYSKVDDEPINNNTTVNEGDDGDYREVSDSHGYLKDAQNNNSFSYSLPTSASKTVSYIEETPEYKIKEKDTGKKTEISSSIDSSKYEKTSSSVDEKWERFLSLLKIEAKNGVFNLKNIDKNDTYIKYDIEDGLNTKVSPENNLLSSEIALYNLLHSNNKTVTFEELMIDLLDIYTGRKKVSEIEFDFNIYEPDDFHYVGEGGIGASYGSIQISDSDFEILCKITSAERGNGTQQQQEYVVSVILNRVLSSSFPNTVHDVVFAPGQFQPTRNGAYNKANPSETTKAAVRNVIANGDTTGGAIYFCTPAAASQASLWSTLKFLFNDNNNALSSHNFYTTPKAQMELAQYSTSSDYSGYAGGIGGNVATVAANLHKYIENNGFTYNKAYNKSIPEGVERDKKIDCSSFVSWVLLKCGFSSFAGPQESSATFYSNRWGWETVNNIYNAKAGDILIYNGHVEIYAGRLNNQRPIVYNCGGNSSVKNSAPSTSGKTVNQIIKIIRPPV